jgi:hypothetical protein
MKKALPWWLAAGAMTTAAVITAVKGDLSWWFTLAALAFTGRALLELGKH